MERRFIPEAPAAIVVENREGREGQTVTGYAAVYYDGTPNTEFNLWDGAVERIMPGAFDRAITEDDPRALFNHDPNNLLGRKSSGTLNLSSTSRGLQYEIALGDTSIARDVREHISRGDLQGSSFAFVVTDEEWRTDGGRDVREIAGVQLYDVGPVTYPAYEATTTDVREARDRYTSKSEQRKSEQQAEQLAIENTLRVYRFRAKQISVEV